MTDFFISYTHADQTWAEWIAFTLEEANFSVVIQAWDFRPGSNFVLEMQQAAASADRTILVLSPDYLNSKPAAAEWASAFAQDPQGVDRRVLPVMVRNCDPKGLLPTIAQIRIMDLDEVAAKEALLAGVDRKRAKPTARPAFPGARVGVVHQVPHVDFPGTVEPHPQTPRSRVLPALNSTPTDADRRRFVKTAFETILDIFRTNLDLARSEEPRLEADLTVVSAVEFSAELFLDGKSKCRCRIWLGGMISENGICYAEGRTTGDGCNEILSPSSSGPLALAAMMAMGFSDIERELGDMKNLTPEQAGEYLWHRFTEGLHH